MKWYARLRKPWLARNPNEPCNASILFKVATVLYSGQFGLLGTRAIIMQTFVTWKCQQCQALSRECIYHAAAYLSPMSACIICGCSNTLRKGLFVQIGTDIPVHSIQQNTSETELCTRSISCDLTYARIAPGVVAIYCVDPVTKTSGLCTGGTSCMNDRKGIAARWRRGQVHAMLAAWILLKGACSDKVTCD